MRCASDTARPATSVDLPAWLAISLIEAASSSTELAAAVTLCEAALTLVSALFASADTASAAPLSLVADTSSCTAAPRSLPSACCTELRNEPMVDAMTSPRCSLARAVAI